MQYDVLFIGAAHSGFSVAAFLARIMTRPGCIAILCLCLVACQPQPEVTKASYAPDSGNLFVRCGMLIDGLADKPATDKMVVIRHGRFAAIVAGEAEIRPGTPFLDLRGFTCLPGLINAHVHLAELPEDALDYGIYYRRTTEDHNNLALRTAGESLLSGFTTVRNIGEFFPNAIYFARDQIDAGRAIGPRIQTAGPYLTIPAGGGDLVVPDYDESEIPPAGRSGVARGPEQFREKAELAVADGADLLKVIASGAVFSYGIEPGLPEMTFEEISAVVEVARAAGIKISAHVHSAQSAKDAILAGVDFLEHASLLDDEAIALAAEHDVALSMDVYNGTYTDTVGREQGYSEELLRRNTDTTEAQRIVFEKAYAQGVPIIYGTDGGVMPHDMGGWQFAIMVERGMAPMDAIKSATSVAAYYMGLAVDVGAVEKGRLGDLIAVRGNPLDDMHVMRSVDVVIKGGLIFKLND
ncbi:MAG: amidohydrolase family protein [Gammaproteobacteria bacterium]|nr:amidohydrolase family protein [Gammaproteobacteria bacterium]